MPKRDPPDLSLFLHILRTLEAIQAPYMMIGAFAATLYGITRTTCDIDIGVNLTEWHIQCLVAAYPPPRYYADPDQMRDSIQKGMMFNIIDSSRGEKADLVPLPIEPRYQQVFQRRVWQMIDLPQVEPFEVWCACPKDVIIGKLMAWAEGRSRRHETDIYEMMVFYYLRLDPQLSADFDETLITVQALSLGAEVYALWQSILTAARQAANQAGDAGSGSGGN